MKFAGPSAQGVSEISHIVVFSLNLRFSLIFGRPQGALSLRIPYLQAARGEKNAPERSRERFLSIFEWFWVPVGLIVRCFFCIWFWSHFSCMFFPQMQKLEKWKSSSGPVKYNVSWGSPSWKKNTLTWKNKFLFPWYLIRKSIKHRIKIQEKQHYAQ